MSQPYLTQSPRRHRSRRARTADHNLGAPRITVSWTADDHAASPTHSATEVELYGDRSLGLLSTLSTARCREVVLTAEVGNDGAAKHFVLELAERLTFALAATQPLIRVLFLPQPALAAALDHSLSLPPPPSHDELSSIGAI